MKWFKKKGSVIDLSEHMKKKEEQKASEAATTEETEEEKPVPFADMFFAAETKESATPTKVEGTLHDRKKKLAKRILEMTNKMEDLSNQIYHLQQRIEVLEKKLDANRY